MESYETQDVDWSQAKRFEKVAFIESKLEAILKESDQCEAKQHIDHELANLFLSFNLLDDIESIVDECSIGLADSKENRVKIEKRSKQ